MGGRRAGTDFIMLTSRWKTETWLGLMTCGKSRLTATRVPYRTPRNTCTWEMSESVMMKTARGEGAGEALNAATGAFRLFPQLLNPT